MANNTIRVFATRMFTLVAICLALPFGVLAAKADDTRGPIDLSNAQVVAPAQLNGPESKALQLLVDEIAARSRRRLPITSAWPADVQTPLIVVGPIASLEQFSKHVEGRLPLTRDDLPAEGFRIRTITATDRAPIVLIAGNDSRGMLYGIGKFLRTLAISRDRIVLTAPLDVTTSPAMSIRGHQIGYRPKTNSYDAWDLPQWEQYLRDLAVFGCNSVELIPPRSDDDDDSPHFPRGKLEMMVDVSQLADDYGLNVWIWYPAMESSYATPESIDAAVREWGAVLSKLPRVDALLVPTGDPGHVPPNELMAMLARQAEQLKQLHPNARIWISMQSFTQPRFEEMLEILRTEPEWLGGIVHGPQTRVSVARLRELLPSRYPIRGYPDITHSMRSEYPVPDWDLAFALTEGREVINPRPLDESQVFRQYAGRAQGVITYSEGCNDDVNKAVWSALCWNPDAQPIDTLRDYSRYFIGDRYADDFAQGLLALERNWRGPLLANDEVATTLQQFRAMENEAAPRTLRNWRFQQALYRANYDAYLRLRLIEETAQEAEAMSVLAGADPPDILPALDQAEAILDRADAPSPADDLKHRVSELAEALFQSIGMQLSVEKYQAIDVNRGANLDEIDVPLNNRVWLKHRFAEIRLLDDNDARLRALNEIIHWTDPGPGGFYDDLGNVSRQPHLVRSDSYADDPGFLRSPSIAFHSDLNWRRSWCTYIDGLYRTPITMRYQNLDPHARYRLRVVYGDYFEAQVRLVASAPPGSKGNQEIEIHPYLNKPQPVRPIEFEIPPAATSSGELTLTWYANPERGGPGRGCQLAEVWLMKIAE